MIVRTLPDGYRVKYVHERPPNVYGAGRMGEYHAGLAPRGGKTIAIILDPERKEVARGESVCRPDENFNKNIGRAVSLGRALKTMERNRV